MKTKKTNKKNQNQQKTTIPVYGMTCTACQNKIELNLLKQQGITDAKANIKENKVEIKYEGEINKKEIQKTIQNLGYKTKKENATKQGILYGLLPHAGCIAFIIASIIGATFFMNLFRPLLMSTYFFYALIAVSIIFATISAAIYLRKNGLLSMQGIRRQKKYLATLYSATIIINLVLFLLIFPLTANFASARASTANENSETVELYVIIPCSGHASLIINELMQEEGVQEAKYTFPYKFITKYDGDITNPEKILEAEIFKEFKASTSAPVEAPLA
jgi:copper chaperone CopZ